MNLTFENIDVQNAILKIKVERQDYEDKVKNKLTEHRRSMKLPGFRPGKVPTELVKKMIGKHILFEEINKVVSDSLTNYLKDNKIDILAEPLPYIEEGKKQDFENDEEFEFSFEIGLKPEFELNLNKEVFIPFYDIEVDEKSIENYIISHCEKFGSLEEVESIENEDLIEGKLEQLDKEGIILDKGILRESALLSLKVVKQEELKEKFLGLKNNDKVDFDLKKTYPNIIEISNLLAISNEEAEKIETEFRLTINKIKRFKKAEINQELYNKVYGEGVVNSEEEYRIKIKDEIKRYLQNEAEYKFIVDARSHLMNNISFALPEKFLLKWINRDDNKNNEKSEQIEKEFPSFLKGLKWQLIQGKIIKQYGINVDESEILDLAKELTLMQYLNYGFSIQNIPADLIEKSANSLLSKDESRQKLFDRKYEDKVFATIKSIVGLDIKHVSLDEFQKIVAEKDLNKVIDEIVEAK